MVELCAKNISKCYGDFKALDGVDIDIRDGEFLTLLGPSGSGKTTLLMILAGFVEQTTGILKKNGVDISSQPAEKRNFGMVFQGYALFPHLTVRQNIEYPLRIRKIPPEERRAKVERMVETVGLGQHGDKKPSQLSGGQQQRVALARSLVFEPDMLLLDEPLSALDRNLREQLRDELKRIHQQTGTTFVFVTHDQSEALALSDRIAIFNHGRIIQHGTAHDIYEDPQSRFVAEFLGQINIIPLQETASKGNTFRGRLHDSTLSAPVNPMLNGSRSPVLAIRPEHMSVSRTKPKNAGNAIKTRITSLTYQGDHTDLTLTTEPQVELSVAIPNSFSGGQPQPGEHVWVSWPVEKGKILPG